MPLINLPRRGETGTAFGRGAFVSDLVVLPSGHLALAETDRVEGNGVPEAALAAFRRSPADGLLHLALSRSEATIPTTFTYWRRFGERYLTELCRTPEPAEDLKNPLPAPDEDLAEFANGRPPMRGGEYVQLDTLQRLWTELDSHVRAQVAACPGGLSAWLRERSPLWHRVGRVSFHLAENKLDSEFPFAFLATYAPKLVDGRRVQYQPLGKALEEFAGMQNKRALANLLTPVQRAAERCAWVKDLIESAEVFHPLRWTPCEAYRFLKDAHVLEECGLLVRMPDWWTKRPPRVHVGVTIGDKKQARFNAQSMLDFKVGFALDGERLSQEEAAQVLASSEGLVFLKGRWVEIDREKLQSALDHWKRVERQIGTDGVSFIEGMRLLAGASFDPGASSPADGNGAAWSEVHAGAWLEERLRELRAPQAIDGPLAQDELRATLRPYQETGLRWLRFLTRLGLGACLADDMGLGKTIQVLALLLLLKREKAAPHLLVVPASLLANWKSERDRFAPELSFRFAHPSLASAEELQKAAADPSAYAAGADAVLTTYGMLARCEWLFSLSWNLVVLDEAQAIKNPAARQTRTVKRLNACARIVLTGTPVENRLTDLWSLFDFLCPGLLGPVKTFGTWVKHLEKREGEPYAPLRKLVSPYILRRFKTDKSIIADLPEKTEMRAFCRLTKKQAALYQRSVEELKHAMEGVDGIRRRGLILAFILRFKQICNHPAQWLASGGYAPEESGKFQRLREIGEEIAARQEKALIFTQFREMTEPLAEFLRTVFGRPGLVLHGQIAVSKRKALVDAFQREEGPPFFVLSLKAGGTGLNLTAAQHVLHFDRWWNPAVENQATDRAFRIGQKRNVVVHKFVCQGTIEEKIDALIQEKTSLAGEILEGGVPKLITEMDDRELLNLVRLDASTIEED
ncbi:MAG: DEAD/DEAH box helicase [Planctomycetes bacterium]|nr:DEAD/DEAH box helicase [Planctomycetota bacterium]